MKKLLTFVLIAVLASLIFVLPTAAADTLVLPDYSYVLSQCLPDGYFSTFTLYQDPVDDSSIHGVNLWDTFGSSRYFYDGFPNGQHAWQFVMENGTGLVTAQMYWHYGIGGSGDYEFYVDLESCDWFTEHYQMVIPNMILFQGIDDPTMVLPIMTNGDTVVSQEQQMFYSGFVGKSVCQAPVYEFMDGYGSIDMQGFWACDDMMNELGGERYPLRCEAAEGESCDSLLFNYTQASGWMVEP